MAVQHNQVRKRLRMEMLAPEDTGMMSLQKEIMELKQENKRLRRDICKALPEVVHEMKDIVGQLQLFAKTLQSTCYQLNQTCQRIPQRDTLNRRMVTQATNRMPQKQKLVKKIGPGQPPIRTVKTVESVLNSSPLQQRKVTLNSNQHYASASPTLSASSPRYSPSAKQSPGPGPFSPSQTPGTPHSGSSPRTPRYPPSTSNPTLPVLGADNLPLVVSNVTSLSKNHFEAPTTQATGPIPVQINSSKPVDSQPQDVFELKPGTGVCIPMQGWISTKMQCGTSESKMVRQLMKFLFLEDELASCSMRGNRLGQQCLDQARVDAIIWRCMEEFPGRTKGHIGQAISQKLQESRSRKKSLTPKHSLSGSGSLSPDDSLPEDIMMVIDPTEATTEEPTEQNGGNESDTSKKSSSGGGGDEVIEVKEEGDAGWR